MNWHDAVSSLGFPIVSALAMAGATWGIVRHLMRTITTSIERGREETLAQFHELHTIQIKLIDRIRMLEDDITRTHVLIASIHELRIPLERLGRAKKDDA